MNRRDRHSRPSNMKLEENQQKPQKPMQVNEIDVILLYASP